MFLSRKTSSGLCRNSLAILAQPGIVSWILAGIIMFHIIYDKCRCAQWVCSPPLESWMYALWTLFDFVWGLRSEVCFAMSQRTRVNSYMCIFYEIKELLIERNEHNTSLPDNMRISFWFHLILLFFRLILSKIIIWNYEW